MKTSTGWALAAIAVLAMGSAHAAQAGSKTGGSAPTGFSSGGQHKGFQTFSTRRRTQPGTQRHPRLAFPVAGTKEKQVGRNRSNKIRQSPRSRRA